MGNNKMTDISPAMVNDTLMENVIETLSDSTETYLIHDPSDIRKPHSKKSENLGKVLDLKGKVINGYSSHNVVVINGTGRSVSLLSHQSYSNKDPKFLKKEFIDNLNAGKKFDDEKEARALYTSGNYFNQKTITTEALKKSSQGIKSAYPTMNITHILDREFDDGELFDMINDELNDDFIIRVKKNRVTEKKDDEGKNIKLIDSDLQGSRHIPIQKVKFKNKVFQDVNLLIEWGCHNKYTVIRATITDREGNNIFKAPMLLITNKNIKCEESAHQVYLNYLKRSKIESVFRFLKDGLGWEDMQIRDFKAIQSLLSLCFYVSAYLYEIGEKVTYDDFSIILADLGGGKGRVTRHYIFKGIQILLMKTRADRILETAKIPKESQDRLSSFAGVGF